MSPTVKKWLHIVSFVLVIIAAIDLGIYGIVPSDRAGLGFDLIQQILGFNQDVLDGYYILTGIAGVYLLVTHIKDCKVCESKKAIKSA